MIQMEKTLQLIFNFEWLLISDGNARSFQRIVINR
jgi:hypothetical protein